MNKQYDVRAVSLDLDGCCFPKNKLPEQPDLLAAYLKTQEGQDCVINLSPYLSRQPPLTFAINTGRSWSASYPVVQAMAGDGLIMAVEHGHGIRMPGEDKPKGIGEIDRKYERQMMALREIADTIYRDPTIAAHRIDKDYFVAVRIPKDADPEEFYKMIYGRLSPTQREMMEDKDGIGAFYSHGAIDIRSRDLSKGTALRQMAQIADVSLENWLVVEDTDRVVLLQNAGVCTWDTNLAGYLGCPSDASEDVQRGLQMYTEYDRYHIASQENGWGTLEILKHFLGD